jgi:hypothetical protein
MPHWFRFNAAPPIDIPAGDFASPLSERRPVWFGFGVIPFAIVRALIGILQGFHGASRIAASLRRGEFMLLCSRRQPKR